MKYLIMILPVFLIFMGCSTSIIKIKPVLDRNDFTMFGKTPSRNFNFEILIDDSLKKKWEAEINGSFPNSSVTVYGNFVFVNDLSGRIFCFDFKTGKEIGQLKSEGAVYTAPIIFWNQIIYVSANEDENTSDLIYYNYLRGKESHSIKIKGRVLTQLIKSDSAVIFNTENGQVYKYNLLGSQIWETDTKSFIHSSPAMENNIIFFGNDEGEIIAVSADKGKILYRQKIGKSFFSSPAINDGIVFIGNDNGFLYAFDSKTGNTKWKFDTGSRITMNPIFNDNTIFIGNLSGKIFAINKENGNEIWQIKTDGILNVTPIITKNYLIIPDMDKKIYFINPSNGKIDKIINLEGRAKLSPVIAKNILFIGYDNGILEAYEF